MNLYNVEKSGHPKGMIGFLSCIGKSSYNTIKRRDVVIKHIKGVFR